MVLFWKEKREGVRGRGRLTATTSPCVTRALCSLCIPTRRLNSTARGFLPSEHGVNHGSCAAHSRFYAECVNRAVSRTGATLHAGIAVRNVNLSIRQTQDRVGTDEKTGTTTHAFLSIKSQCNNILEIHKLT